MILTKLNFQNIILRTDRFGLMVEENRKMKRDVSRGNVPSPFHQLLHLVIVLKSEFTP